MTQPSEITKHEIHDMNHIYEITSIFCVILKNLAFIMLNHINLNHKLSNVVNNTDLKI